jgi:hypothetical protein
MRLARYHAEVATDESCECLVLLSASHHEEGVGKHQNERTGSPEIVAEAGTRGFIIGLRERRNNETDTVRKEGGGARGRAEFCRKKGNGVAC